LPNAWSRCSGSISHVPAARRSRSQGAKFAGAGLWSIIGPPRLPGRAACCCCVSREVL